jgi:hypothetical protein
MTFVFIFGLCIAGFAVGFLGLYLFRKQYVNFLKKPGKSAGPEGKKPACLWCGSDRYPVQDPSFKCPRCGNTYHAGCWKEYGGCSEIDCQMSAANTEVTTKA